MTAKVNPKKSLSKNLEAGCKKEQLMDYYGIKSEEQWNKLMASINDAKAKRVTTEKDVRTNRKQMKPFEELITNTKKKNYDDYLRDEMREERDQIIKGVKFEKELESNFREKLENGELEWKLGTVPDNMIEWANKELNSGNVAAVDGTNMFPMDLISGTFCQVGVGGLSYTNDEPSINVQSITSHITNDMSAGDYFGDLLFGKEKQLSKFDIAAAMSYWELEHCLERKEKWIFHDGNVIPREHIETEVGVDLLKKITHFNNIIGIIKGSKSLKYRLLGRFLRPNEYIIIESTKEFFDNMRQDERYNTAKRYSEVGGEFINKYSTHFKRGIFKAHTKSYVFEIHEDVFDKAIALIMADSMRNPRGLPFLIDLIDSKLSALFETNIYRDRMFNLLLEQGELMENINERVLRSW